MFYKIVVRGELTERFAGAFEGMKMEAGSGQTTLTGEVIDQCRLYGIINRLNGLGLTLLSVQALPENTEDRGGTPMR
jgi:hypothetical protein